jgi:hypothetical protein
VASTTGQGEKPLVASTYSKLLEGGRHHGAIQTGYRIMASTWLLATFAAIGFLLSGDVLLPFSHLLGVTIACLLGIVGLYLIWYEDTFVQEMLLDIHVVEALLLEERHNWLPQVHHNFLHLYKHSNARIVKVLFFMGCKSILVFIAATALGFYFYPMGPHLTIATIAACIVLNFLSSKLMLKKSGKIQEFIDFMSYVDRRNKR